MSDGKHHDADREGRHDDDQKPQPTPGPARIPADPTSVPPVDPDPPSDQ